MGTTSTYCIYELRFSEEEAFRRVSAARLVRRFPVLLDVIIAGELHLTGLLMLGPHLTTENLVEVLARAKHRTKKESGRLVRMLDPMPDVPSRIDPLGPEPTQIVPAAPTWSQFVGSMNPARKLAPGDRPLDWTEDTVEEPASDRCQARGEFAWQMDPRRRGASSCCRMDPRRRGASSCCRMDQRRRGASSCCRMDQRRRGSPLSATRCSSRRARST